MRRFGEADERFPGAQGSSAGQERSVEAGEVRFHNAFMEAFHARWFLARLASSRTADKSGAEE